MNQNHMHFIFSKLLNSKELMFMEIYTFSLQKLKESTIQGLANSINISYIRTIPKILLLKPSLKSL